MRLEVAVPLSYGRGVGGEGSRAERASPRGGSLIRRAVARRLLPKGEGKGAPR
jgi:hypothetical protein